MVANVANPKSGPPLQLTEDHWWKEEAGATERCEDTLKVALRVNLTNHQMKVSDIMVRC